MDRLKILIADDEAVVRQGIAKLISTQKDSLELVACASNGEEALKTLKSSPVDILITDIRMPKLTGIELIDEIERAGIELLAIIISAYNDTDYLKHAIKSRIVYDYVFKPFSMSEFDELLRVAAGFWRKRKKEIQDIKLFAGDNGEERDEDFLDIQKSQFRIMSFIQSDDVEGAVSQLQREWQRRGERDPVKCARMACELSMKIDWWLQRHGEAGNDLFRLLSHMKVLELEEDPGHILEYIIEYIRESCRDTGGKKRVTALVASCIEEMNRHLADSEFSLTQAADLLEVTPNYLSARFSRDMGISFTKYLNLLRVEKSKELLADIRLKVYSISEMVGFKEARYFARIFREIAGITPSDYRQEIINRMRSS